MEPIDKQSKRLGRVTLAVYREADPVAEKAAKTMGATCSKGCSHCCHLLTIVTFPEAVAIAEHLLTDLQWQANLGGLLSKLYEQINLLADPNLTRKSYFEKKIPCVFLGMNNECRIYPVRPTACRYHYVVSDPANCSHEAPENVETARIDLIALESKVWQEESRVSRQVGTPMFAAPLQVSLLWALKFLGENRAAFEKALTEDHGVMGPLYWMNMMATDSPLASEILESAKKRVERLGEETK